ncbi:MAG TPA: rhomboid family intramembrane serine protease [Planctomycetota bacterium]|nr:rhomboid family intramembrane serine protease [Planctomycetota bacterium]
MGIYDREYMDGTDDSPYGSAAERRFSGVSVLIIINIVVWVLWQFAQTNLSLKVFLLDHFTCSPQGVLRDYRLWTLWTASISHEGLFHVAFNMLFFWFLGQEVELRYGRRNFYWIYFLTAFLTGLGYVGVELLKANMFIAEPHAALGASGCVMGVGVIAAFLDPDRPINVWGIIPVKLKWLVGFYVFADILGMVGSPSGIGHAGHLGGALGGFVFYWFDLRLFGSPGRSNVGMLHTIRGWFRRKPKLRVVEKRVPDENLEVEKVATSSRPKQAAAGARPTPSVDAETSRRVDELLDKIHREGMGALTQEEKDFLNASSEKYKRK